MTPRPTTTKEPIVPDIWDRVDEAIDTDPLQLRDIVAEVLRRGEHAEKAAVVNRERSDQYRQERDEQRGQLAALVGVDPCTEWGDVLDSVNEIRRERDEARAERDHTRHLLTTHGYTDNVLAALDASATSTSTPDGGE